MRISNEQSHQIPNLRVAGSNPVGVAISYQTLSGHSAPQNLGGTKRISNAVGNAALASATRRPGELLLAEATTCHQPPGGGADDRTTHIAKTR